MALWNMDVRVHASQEFSCYLLFCTSFFQYPSSSKSISFLFSDEMFHHFLFFCIPIFSFSLPLTFLESSPEDSPETHSTQTYSKFLETLVNSTQFSSFRDLATLFYGDGNTGASSVVSSIEFDKDGELFAVAGVTKKIKVCA